MGNAELERVYFDNAATTPVRDEVLEEMLPYFRERYGNPSSLYSIAGESKKAVETARERLANALNAEPGEIYFTSGGTESDNWAIAGTAERAAGKGRHLITSAIEHHGILNVFKKLEKNGFEVTYLPVDAEGLVSPEELEKAIRPDTILISVMYANNEIGTVQPIDDLAGIAAARGVPFHTDAVQAAGHIPIDLKKTKADMLSLSAHKFNGPKGVGALFIRKGKPLEPFLLGGHQEKGRRPGTENVPGIVGLGKAAALAVAEMPEESARLAALRDRLIDGILGGIPHTRLNGSRTKRLPGNVSVAFEFIEGESLLLLLDMKNICASSGSACTSGSLDPSHVLLAIGLPHEKAHGSLRLTLGRYNTADEAEYVLRELPPLVARLRDMSPLYKAGVKTMI
ncbi:MAG: cysteine desulfurase NifS [Firmicutes bacterium]|nr:cysteine desulfurase NifS [Bacillota bacterium]